MAKNRDYWTEKTLECFWTLPRKAQDIYLWYLLSSKKNEFEILDLDVLEFEVCESPIEKIMCLALNIVSHEFYYDLFGFYTQKNIECNGKKYRADFYVDSSLLPRGGCNLEVSEKLKVVIECDGHEFHQKTKEQVKKNNERDMALKKEGYEVLHFSGSQIFKDPICCAKDVMEYIAKKIEWEAT